MGTRRVSNHARTRKRTVSFSIDIAPMGTGASDFHDSPGVPTAHGLPKVTDQEVFCHIATS